MSQASFKFPSPKKTVADKTLVAEADNLYAARTYKADPEKYPGILQVWADMVLGRLK